MTLNSSLGIASEGLDASAGRLQISANNVANIHTPYYKRKIPILVENNELTFQGVLTEMRNGVFHTGITNRPGGVILAGSAADPTPGKRVYEPGHPQADADGYVTYSNSNILADMADATVSQRVYEANLAVVSMVKAMANRALEIGRGQ